MPYMGHIVQIEVQASFVLICHHWTLGMTKIGRDTAVETYLINYSCLTIGHIGQNLSSTIPYIPIDAKFKAGFKNV